MSSLTIIQEHDQITFAVDTARCMGDSDGKMYRYYGLKVQKIHKAGLDMVFIAGMTECTEYVESRLQSFVNKKQHVNIERLKQCLNKEFPKEKCKWSSLGLNDIGVTILSVLNGESIVYFLEQESNYEPTMKKASKENISLYVDGFDNKKIHTYAKKCIQQSKNFKFREPDTFIDIYQHNYSESVGGYIQIYSMGSDGCEMVEEKALSEKDLRYVVEPNNTQMLKKLCELYSANVTSSRFIGGSIYSPDYAPDQKGMKIDLDNGTIDAVNLKVDATGRLTATNGTFNGTVISQSEDGYEVIIENGDITARRSDSMAIYYHLGTGEDGCTFENINCNSLNGSVPVTQSWVEQNYQPSGNYLVASDLSEINTKLGNHESRIYAIERRIGLA